jgi:glycosyltransferase involved in cell wall biosynthesis
MIPWRLKKPVRRTRNAVAAGWATAREYGRWRNIMRTPPRARELAVSYGVERMPSDDDVVIGGNVKFQVLSRELPNAPRDFNVLYLGSSSMPIDATMLVRVARRRGAVFVWNQNGVAYSGWYGPGWELVNAPRARLLRRADHVVYQSRFCKVGADRFYGEPCGSWEILPNPVDTRRFLPASRQRRRRPLTLLLGGSQYQRYRVTVALETLALVRREHRDARLQIAGALTFSNGGDADAVELVRRLDLTDAVEFIGPYVRADAPALMQGADILLHPKYNDPCPTVVLEAMSAGLPVVFSASGGTPELVGEDAGIGVPAPLDWDEDHPPAATDLADGVIEVASNIAELGDAARARAVEHFDARRWIERHREIFERLVMR